jgi:hypothetical protein
MNSSSMPFRSDAIFEVSVDEVSRSLHAILEPGEVTEVRALGVSTADHRWTHVVSGYFDDLDKLAEAVRRIESYQGIYFIPNPVDPAVIARAHNRVRKIEKQSLTSDREIIRRRWLLIDIDPVRASGISSSTEEHQIALDAAREMRIVLSEEGWPSPIIADSGNGSHLLYRIDLPVDDNELVKRTLAGLAARFDTPHVIVDRTVFNPARIWKQYGSWARKGDSTSDRPHRMAKVLEVPDDLEIVPGPLLAKLAVASSTNRGQITLNRSAFNVNDWIEVHRLELLGPKPWRGGQRWIFPRCPWNPDHKNSAFIVQLENGGLAAGCHHNSCANNNWEQLLLLYDRVRAGSKNLKNSPLPTSAGNLRGAKPEILVPGEHDCQRVGHDDIAHSLRNLLPVGTKLFRHGPEFVQLLG